MNEGRTVFAQLLDFRPKYEFDKWVARYHGNRRVRKLPACEPLLVLAFAQLTWRESLRDVETCLASFGPKLYHAGIRQPTAPRSKPAHRLSPPRGVEPPCCPGKLTNPRGQSKPRQRFRGAICPMK